MCQANLTCQKLYKWHFFLIIFLLHKMYEVKEGACHQYLIEIMLAIIRSQRISNHLKFQQLQLAFFVSGETCKSEPAVLCSISTY